MALWENLHSLGTFISADCCPQPRLPPTFNSNTQKAPVVQGHSIQLFVNIPVILRMST